MNHAIELVLQWPVDAVAAAGVVGDDVTVVGLHDRRFPLASLTKLTTALAVLIAVEEGTLALDYDVSALVERPDLAPLRVAELLSHSSGLAPDMPARRLAPEAQRRIYSNAGYEIAAEAVTRRSGIDFETYLHDAVFAPLAMRATTLSGSPASGATSTVDDLVRFLRELHAPRLISSETHNRMVTAHHRGLGGVLPGFGRHLDNSWGLGPEIRGQKSPHWSGSLNSPQTYGHFGATGTLLWWDPIAERGLIALTTRDFGDWAMGEWPPLADAVLSQNSPSVERPSSN